MTELHFLPAAGGDFLWLRFGALAGEMHNMIIDSGYRSCFSDFNAILRSIARAKETIDAIVLTHIDDDHIGGFLCWLESVGTEYPAIERIYFNTGRGISGHMGDRGKTLEGYFEDSIRGAPSNGDYSVKNACSILELLRHKKLLDRLCSYSVADGSTATLPCGASMRFISPSEKAALAFGKLWRMEEKKTVVNYGAVGKNGSPWDDLDALMGQKEPPDSSVSNGASLAFLFDFADTHLAFLGDAHADVCVEGLRALGYTPERPYPADLVKLSHHGSACNLSGELLALLDGRRFLVSTAPGKYKKTQKAAVAQLLRFRETVELYFNCSCPDRMFSRRDQEEYLQTGQLILHNVGFGGPRSRIALKDGLMLCGKTKGGVYDGQIQHPAEQSG